MRFEQNYVTRETFLSNYLLSIYGICSRERTQTSPKMISIKFTYLFIYTTTDDVHIIIGAFNLSLSPYHFTIIHEMKTVFFCLSFLSIWFLIKIPENTTQFSVKFSSLLIFHYPPAYSDISCL